MRIQYSSFLHPNIISLLKSHLPEPPSDAEMRLELAGMERLEEALKDLEEL